MLAFRCPKWLGITFSVWMCFQSVHAVAASTIVVFAASSTQPVIDALALKLKDRAINVKAVYASSATLARQIQNGARADVFISANTKWMDVLAANALIAKKTRLNIATNTLALIANKEAVNLKKGATILENLGPGRLAIADTDTVPAGMYARQALVSTHQWTALKSHLAPAKDVTSALMFVVRGEASLGIVYASDARRTNKVKVIFLFSSKDHRPIYYQAAIVKNRISKTALEFLNYLVGPIGQAEFKTAGFGGKP